MSGGSNSSTRCANLVQEASRKCWRLHCSWQSRKEKSLLPARGLQEKEHWEENWGKTCWAHRQNSQLPPEETQAMWTGHQRRGWERKTAVIAQVAPMRQLHWETQHHDAQEQGRQRPDQRDPLGALTAPASRHRRAKWRSEQWLLMEIVTFLSSTTGSSRLG